METKNNSIITDKELKIGKNYRIETLLKMSDILEEYKKYPDEDLPIGSKFDLILDEGGYSIEMEGITYIDQRDNIKLEEGTHFKFI